MLTFIRTTEGLGDSEVAFRLRDGANFWNFDTEGWDAAEGANTRVLMTERADSDTLESLYIASITLPTGGPYIQEAYRITGNAVLGTDITMYYSNVVAYNLGVTGAITWPYTLTRSDTGDPIVGATVWVSSDSDGTTVLTSGVTDSNGVVVFYLDPGTVYVWRQAAGYNFTNPDLEVIV